MKKTLLALIMLPLTALLLNGCMKDDYDETLTEVYPGYEMYLGAASSNELALDAVSIAMRLSMLLNEIEESNINNGTSIAIGTEGEDEPDWDELDEVTINSKEYNPKEVLIGDSDGVQIWRDGDIYYIKYYSSTGYHTKSLFDNLYRSGTFMINTKGVKLEEATLDLYWTVTAVDDKITYSTGSNGLDYSEYYCDYSSSSTMMIYYGDATNENDETIKAFNFYVSYISPNQTVATYTPIWYMAGYVNIVDWDITSTLNIDNTFDRCYELNVEAEGTPMSVPYAMTYETLTPIKYYPSTEGYAKFSSQILISLKTTSTDYPAADALIEFRDDGGLNITYNGMTYIN